MKDEDQNNINAYAPNMPEESTQEEAAPHKPEKKECWLLSRTGLLVAGAISVALVAAATLLAQGNADYICTRVIENESACAVDEWGAWEEVQSGTPGDACTTYQVEQHRVGTGTKVLSTVIEYLNRRTSCQAGFTQERHGSSGGSSGYMGEGRAFTSSAVCQLEERRTIQRTVPGDSCELTPEVVIGEIDQQETVVGGVVAGGGDEIVLDGLDAINAFRASMVDLSFVAVPALVPAGGVAEIRWATRETVSCQVEGSNGDAWLPTEDNGRTSGTETSSPINGLVTYTLTCTTFNNETITDTLTIAETPIWNEQ